MFRVDEAHPVQKALAVVSNKRRFGFLIFYASIDRAQAYFVDYFAGFHIFAFDPEQRFFGKTSFLP